MKMNKKERRLTLILLALSSTLGLLIVWLFKLLRANLYTVLILFITGLVIHIWFNHNNIINVFKELIE